MNFDSSTGYKVSLSKLFNQPVYFELVIEQLERFCMLCLKSTDQFVSVSLRICLQFWSFFLCPTNIHGGHETGVREYI